MFCIDNANKLSPTTKVERSVDEAESPAKEEPMEQGEASPAEQEPVVTMATAASATSPANV